MTNLHKLFIQRCKLLTVLPVRLCTMLSGMPISDSDSRSESFFSPNSDTFLLMNATCVPVSTDCITAIHVSCHPQTRGLSVFTEKGCWLFSPLMMTTFYLYLNDRLFLSLYSHTFLVYFHINIFIGAVKCVMILILFFVVVFSL